MILLISKVKLIIDLIIFIILIKNCVLKSTNDRRAIYRIGNIYKIHTKIIGIIRLLIVRSRAWLKIALSLINGEILNICSEILILLIINSVISSYFIIYISGKYFI